MIAAATRDAEDAVGDAFAMSQRLARAEEQDPGCGDRVSRPRNAASFGARCAARSFLRFIDERR